MPALSGSLTYTRLFVQGDLPVDHRERFIATLRLRAMKPLEADDDVTERCGWCALSEPYELALGHEQVFYNNYLNLGFRSDRWAIPAALLKANIREAESVHLEKKGRERLNKREREEIKEFVLRQMRRQTTPVVRVVDFCWSLEEGIVRFFSHSQRSTLAMMELFTKTFGLKLVPEAPFTLAARLGLSDEAQQAWDVISPTVLARQEG